MLKSAIANAENNNNIRPELLVIKEAVVGEAVTMKRIMTRARGSAGAIRKRTSHIRIIVTDEVPIDRRYDRAEKKKTSNKKIARANIKSAVAPETAVASIEPVSETAS